MEKYPMPANMSTITSPSHSILDIRTRSSTFPDENIILAASNLKRTPFSLCTVTVFDPSIRRTVGVLNSPPTPPTSRRTDFASSTRAYALATVSSYESSCSGSLSRRTSPNSSHLRGSRRDRLSGRSASRLTSSIGSSLSTLGGNSADIASHAKSSTSPSGSVAVNGISTDSLRSTMALVVSTMPADASTRLTRSASALSTFSPSTGMPKQGGGINASTDEWPRPQGHPKRKTI